MKIYIDSDYKCYTENADDRREVETDFFDGKCRRFIEGYRFVPTGEQWTREDGVIFYGEMITCWKSYEVLREIQEAYEEGLDMRSALEVLGVTE